MLNSIQNTELVRMTNKLTSYVKSVNFQIESLSSDREYKDGLFTIATDEVRLVGVIQGKALIHIHYTIKYNFGISKEYEHTLSGSIMTQDGDAHFVSTDFPKDVDSIDALIRYLKTTFK